MSEDRRKHLRDVLDDLDRYFDDFERTFEDAIRMGFAKAGESAESVFRPLVTGMTIDVSADGKPTVRFFGNNPKQGDGSRSPLYEQVPDDEEGTLRLIVELPGVEKENIQMSATENRAILQAEKGERRYKVEMPFQREVDAESGKATYRNGLLEVTFKQKDKANKGYRRVSVV